MMPEGKGTALLPEVQMLPRLNPLLPQKEERKEHSYGQGSGGIQSVQMLCW